MSVPLPPHFLKIKKHGKKGVIKKGLLHISNLYKYQCNAINYMLAKRKVMMYMFISSGKTITGLTWLSRLFKAGETKPALMISTVAICQTVWAQESDRWSHTNNLKIIDMTGNPKKRMQALCRKGDMYMINFENLSWLTDVLNT